MKTKLTQLIGISFALVIGILNINAQTAPTPQILVAAGSSSGTYTQFLGEIIKTLPAGIIEFKQVDSHGSIENLDKLINNECSAAFLHSDVIYARSLTDDMSSYKTLLALFQEEVHILALTTSKRYVTNIVSGNTLASRFLGNTITRTNITYNTIEDLKTTTVGAAGGGYITAQLIRIQSQIPYKIVQYASGKELLAALNEGTVDAAFFVGGAPLPNIKTLGKEYKLLSIPINIAEKLSTTYKRANITYNNLSPVAVSTVAADCLLVAKQYKSPKMVNSLKSFRTEFFKNLDELKETPGNHRKWQQVDSENHGRWAWMELN